MTDPRRVTAQSAEAVLGDRLRGTPLVLLLDVDGTLAPIAPTPGDARVPDDTKRVLRTLVSQPDVCVALVSGRSAHDAARLADVDGVWVIGNHGFEWREPDGDIVPLEAVAPFESIIAKAAAALESLPSEAPGAIVENKRWTLSIHYRNVAPDRAAALIERVHAVAVAFALRVSEGKKVVELRPPIAVNKGTASTALAEQLGGFTGGGSVVYAGDDRTDEDAFGALRSRMPSAVTIRVHPGDAQGGEGAPETAAEFLMDTPEELRALLESIAERRGTRAAR